MSLSGTNNTLRIINYGHMGNNNNFLKPCEWTATNYLYNHALDTKIYSTYSIREVDLGNKLIQSYTSGFIKDHNAVTDKFRDKIPNVNGLRVSGLDLSTNIDLSFYQGSSYALDTSKNIRPIHLCRKLGNRY